MRAAKVRIGRVKLKGGAELRLLPSAHEERARNAMAWFDHHVKQAKEVHAEDLAGYAVAAWDHLGGYTLRYRCYTQTPSINTLPVWLAEAVRRETAHVDL